MHYKDFFRHNRWLHRWVRELTMLVFQPSKIMILKLKNARCTSNVSRITWRGRILQTHWRRNYSFVRLSVLNILTDWPHFWVRRNRLKTYPIQPYQESEAPSCLNIIFSQYSSKINNQSQISLPHSVVILMNVILLSSVNATKQFQLMMFSFAHSSLGAYGIHDNWLREQLLQSGLTDFNEIVNKAIACEASRIESQELNPSKPLNSSTVSKTNQISHSRRVYREDERPFCRNSQVSKRSSDKTFTVTDTAEIFFLI